MGRFQHYYVKIAKNAVFYFKVLNKIYFKDVF